MRILRVKPADEAGSATPAILIGLFVSLGGILFGYGFLLQFVNPYQPAY